MKYFFKANNQAGEIVEGTREAADKITLYKDLQKEGLTMFTASEKNIDWFAGLNEKFEALTSRVKTQDKIIFAKNMGAMIEAGLPMARALEVLQRQTKNKKFKQIINSLGEEIKKGKTLSEAMQLYPKVFSQLFISMTHAGEESGDIAHALGIVGQQMEKTSVLQKKIRGAMMYPSVILVLMGCIAILMMVYVVPTLVSTFNDLKVELPWSTKLIIFVSNLFIHDGLLLLVGAVILAAIVSSLAKTAKGKRVIDRLWLKFPVVGGLVREINAARTARTLSALLSSGVDMIVAMEITEQVIQNVYFKEVVAKAKKVIQNGETISGVFMQNQDLYPSFVGEMMSVGEETGKLGSMLMEVAVYYENEVDQKTKDMSTIIEPFLMIVIGAGVGFFAISMLSPTYSVLSNIK